MWAKVRTAGLRCIGSMPPISQARPREGQGGSPDVPVVSKTPEEAANHFGWFAHFAGLDAPALA